MNGSFRVDVAAESDHDLLIQVGMGMNYALEHIEKQDKYIQQLEARHDIRLRSLEDWRNYLAGGLAIVAFLGGTAVAILQLLR